LVLPENLISDQFFRGLSPDNQLEVERLGDVPIDNIVRSLEKIERRKSEMRLGIIDRKTKQIIQSHNVNPVQMPHVSQQEPVVLKSEQFTLDEVNKLIQNTVERITQQFQTQIETLQNKLPQVTTTVSSLEEYHKPPLSRRDLMNKHIEEVRRNKDAHEDRRAKLISRFLEKEEQDSLDRDLARMLNNLSLKDPDDMDTSNMIRGEEIVIDDDGFLRKKK
jgi:septal ring factor EnvC (AmiA/AmiB activator)